MANNNSAQFVTSINAALQSAGMDQKKAAAYAQHASDVVEYIDAHPGLKAALIRGKQTYDAYGYAGAAKDMYRGAVKVEQVTNYLRNAGILGLTSATKGFDVARLGGATEGLSGFVDLFEGVAKANNIELANWSLSVSKVALSFAAVMTAGTAAPAIASFAGALILFTVFKESYNIGAAFTK